MINTNAKCVEAQMLIRRPVAEGFEAFEPDSRQISKRNYLNSLFLADFAD